jgi:hypothetical protein
MPFGEELGVGVAALDQPIDLRSHKATLMFILETLSVEKNILIAIESCADEE